MKKGKATFKKSIGIKSSRKNMEQQIVQILELLKAQVFNTHFWINILDILLVWFIVYKTIMLLKGTKAIQVVKGVALILVIRMVSGWIGLNTISWLMDQFITYGVIAAIVIFQPEIRKGLEHLGRFKLFKKKTQAGWKNKEDAIILAYDKAIQYMSKRRIGALITIQRKVDLEEYIETGIPIDADISGELLINIFIPNTPLHDGAVIIREDHIAVACAYLPLSERTTIPKEYGTRHRAAVGISEVSDAVTIVVSEETGNVSITLNGEMYNDLSQEMYLKILRQELIVEEEANPSIWEQLRNKGGRKRG